MALGECIRQADLEGSPLQFSCVPRVPPIKEVWNPEVGDCRQELVFIGIEMDELEIYDSLQACLLTDQEFALGPAARASFSDPFPKWNRTVEEVLATLG